MPKPKLLKEFTPGRGYTEQDWDEVSDNPEWTEEDFKRARPFAEMFPDWARKIEEGKVGGLELVGVDIKVVERLQEQGPGWEKRMNDILRKAVGL